MNFRLLVSVCILLAAVFAITVQTANAQEDAEIRTSDVRCPAEIKENRTGTITVRVRNNGQTTWRGKGKYFLKITIPRGPSGSAVQRDELQPFTVLQDDVAPREYHTFSIKIEGPSYTGTYTLQFQMANNNQTFGDARTCTIQVIR